jgi:hypothetical protein
MISYAIPVCTERDEIENLTKYLLKYKSKQDEIIILVDELNHTQEVKDYVETFAEECQDQNVIRAYHPLNGDFATHKNYLNSLCSGDWIFQLDADEFPDEYLMSMFTNILAANPDVDAYWVARINTVAGITEAHIQKWGWMMTHGDRINFPDYQLRLYRNNPEIKWTRKVHEQLVGYKKFAQLPANDEYCLHHPKTIERQEQQNKFYETLQ